jgi:tetrahydromethanopterin S-methyltransferase subunit B
MSRNRYAVGYQDALQEIDAALNSATTDYEKVEAVVEWLRNNLEPTETAWNGGPDYRSTF